MAMRQDDKCSDSSSADGGNDLGKDSARSHKSRSDSAFFGDDCKDDSSGNNTDFNRKRRESDDSAMETDSDCGRNAPSPRAMTTASNLFNNTFACGVRRVTKEELKRGLSKQRKDEIISSLQLNHLPFWNEQFQEAMKRHKIKTVPQLLNWNLTNSALLSLTPRVQTCVLNLRDWDNKPIVMAAFLQMCQRRMRPYNSSLSTPRYSSRTNRQTRRDDVSGASPSSGSDDSVSGARPRKRNKPSQESMTESLSMDFEENDLDGGCLMDSIPHLSRCTIDQETGYPVRHFSVLDQEENIFDFRLNVNASTIPGSGRGAFLTYLGARILKKECRERSDEKMKDREAFIPDTMQPLEAISADGYGITVKLTGDNLHGNKNLLYWPITTFPLTAAVQNSAKGSPRPKQVRVTLTGEQLHYDSEDEEDYMTHLDMVPTPFGFLGRHVESDYVPSNKTFSNKCGVIDLGRYGPFLKSDRKTKTEFDLKDFIFSHEPSGWNFGVGEMLHGEEQIIDITSDATGEPHALAQLGGDMMMYVNEVGHNTELQQNVQALEKDGRTVHYYLDIATSLQKNQTVELFVDYHDQYEPSRERKGYGKKNIEGGVRGDDHEATRLKRNFLERKDIEQFLESLTVVQLYELVEYMHTSMLNPVAQVTNEFMQHLQNQIPSPRSVSATSVKHPSLLQWCARRRLHWTSEHLTERVWRLEKLARIPGALKSFPYRGMLGAARDRLEEMKWNSVDNLLKSLNCDEGDVYEKEVYAGLTFEMSEEYLYELSRNGLLDPLDKSRWCPIAIQLTKRLCEEVYIVGSSLHDKRLTKDKLVEILLGIAGTAADCVRRACQSKSPENLQQLQFDSGVCQRNTYVNTAYLRRCEVVLGSNPLDFEHFSKFPMGLSAAMAVAYASPDTSTVGESEAPMQIPVSTNGAFLVTIKNKATVSPRESTPKSSLPNQVVPRKAKDVADGLASPDEQWYVLWQVVYLAHTFASKFFERELGSEEVYSLAQLCQATNVDMKDAKAMVECGMKPFEHPDLPKFDSQRTSSKAKQQKKPSPKSGQPRPRGALFHEIVWKALEDIGWTMDKGNRPTDYYFLPPGVARGKGFKPRVDFFDSVSQVVTFLETDSRWKDKDEVISCLKLYRSCAQLQRELRYKRQLPKGQMTVEWLVSQVEKKESPQ